MAHGAWAAWTGIGPGLEAMALPGARPTLVALPGAGSNAAGAAGARVLVVVDESPEGLRFVDPDAGTELGFLALSSRPVALAVDSSGARAYVVTDSGRLLVIDIAARTQLAGFDLGGNPRALLVREESGSVVEVLVAQKGPDRVIGVNPATGAVPRLVALERDPTTLAWALNLALDPRRLGRAAAGRRMRCVDAKSPPARAKPGKQCDSQGSSFHQ